MTDPHYHLLLFLVLIVAACGTTSYQPAAPPGNVRWTLVELGGAPVLASPVGREPDIRFAGDSARVTGFTTCNRFFGSYAAPGAGRLRFGQLGSTKMACVEPERGQQEQRFMAALQSIDRFAVTGDTLTLYERDRPRVRFVATR